MTARRLQAPVRGTSFGLLRTAACGDAEVDGQAAVDQLGGEDPPEVVRGELRPTETGVGLGQVLAASADRLLDDAGVEDLRSDRSVLALEEERRRRTPDLVVRAVTTDRSPRCPRPRRLREGLARTRLLPRPRPGAVARRCRRSTSSPSSYEKPPCPRAPAPSRPPPPDCGTWSRKERRATAGRAPSARAPCRGAPRAPRPKEWEVAGPATVRTGSAAAVERARCGRDRPAG